MGSDGRKREAKKGRDQPQRIGIERSPSGMGGASIGRGGRSGDATALTLHQAVKVRRDGVKDAGETGARTAPPDARAGIAVSVTDEPPD